VKLAILAGGKGTRLGLKKIPKPMVQIGGKPNLEHQLCLAKRYGIEDIYILSNHMAGVIKHHLGDGSVFGINITHIVEQNPLGTAGAVRQLENTINERFLLFYGDVVLNMDLDCFVAFDKESYSLATIVVHPNDHPYDSDLVEINEEKFVTGFHSKEHKTHDYCGNLVNAGAYILSPEIFEHIPNQGYSDFGRDIFPSILKSKKSIRAYKTAEYLKDIGTVDRLKKVRADFANGKVKRSSKKNKMPAVFIDRDGTLTREVHLLHRIEDLDLLAHSDSAIRMINDSDFMCFIVSNQSVVARNLCNISTMKQIHNKLETLLGRESAYLNDIYFCPHHPDKGYPEENPIFKIDCDCRKPGIGMIDRAVKEYNVDIETSWIVGDTTTDMQTGRNAGLQTVLVRTGKGGKDGKFQCDPDFVFDNLEAAVEFILKGRNRFDLYVKEIIDNISKDKGHPPFIISVAGLARSGKSTFVKLLEQSIQKEGISTKILSLDNWLIGVNERTDVMTVKQRYKYDEAGKDISKLMSQGKILLKTYDPYSRNIVDERYFSLGRSKCLIIDGIPLLDIEQLRKISNVRIYVEIDEHIRKERFFSYYRWKDLRDEEIHHLYEKRLKDEVPFIEKSKKHANITIEV